MDKNTEVMGFKIGDHVRVTDKLVWLRGDHTVHPQSGRSGIIDEFFVLQPKPAAMLKLDDKSGFIRVSLEFLEPAT